MKLIYVILLLAVMTLGHFIANSTGLYEGDIIWIDNVLHIMAGAALALLWLELLRIRLILLLFVPNSQSRGLPNRVTQLRQSSVTKEESKQRIIVSTLLFVFVLAILWELIEFLFLIYFPSYAFSLNLYSSSVLESMEDVLSNLIGGTIVCLLFRKNRKSIEGF